MNKPNPQPNGFHPGFFKARIADIADAKRGYPLNTIEKEYVADIVQALSERIGVNLSDFPIGSRDIQLEALAQALHRHYLKKLREKESIGSPQTPS